MGFMALIGQRSPHDSRKVVVSMARRFLGESAPLLLLLVVFSPAICFWYSVAIQRSFAPHGRPGQARSLLTMPDRPLGACAGRC